MMALLRKYSPKQLILETTNNNFEYKKNLYQESKYIKIPSNSNEIGINKYNDFTYEEIIIRTLKLVNKIVEKYKNEWFDI